MSCNGCRVLRKGCNDKCILRQSLSGIESSQAQSHATVFVAKFFGRAGLMSFLSSVTDSQRPALFQSLLFEACGRTINPVSGAVGLLWTGNWHVCQSAVESVLCGGVLHSISKFSGQSPPLDSRHLSSPNGLINGQDLTQEGADLDLCLTRKRDRYAGSTTTAGWMEKRRSGTPNSDESDTTTYESGTTRGEAGAAFAMEPLEDSNKLLRLFF